ncbi:MAG: tyrosine-type recombinase/integrase [Acidimicrobiales bacterium]
MPHKRHTCAMRLLESEIDLATIALWLDHSSLQSTNIYLHADMVLKGTWLPHFGGLLERLRGSIHHLGGGGELSMWRVEPSDRVWPWRVQETTGKRGSPSWS